MILYVYSKCSTCQKALKFLAEKKIPFIRKEIVETPPSVKELHSMLQHVKGKNFRKMFNSSGQLYREMGLATKLTSMSEESALLLLSQHGMLVKRPFLLGDDFGLLGFNETEWSKFIKY